jgi:poly(3-hydroxyoctanoate) depolymerase
VARSVDERTVRLEGLGIHIRAVGDGPPVLLINGLGANTGVWANLEEVLSGFTLIEFDAPGTGRSEMPGLPVSVPRLARIATGVLDAVGVDCADVLGYSLGGIVAQQLAADAPERVRRLVLVATTVGLGSVSSDAKSLLHIAAPARFLSEQLYAKSLGSLTGGRARHDPAWAKALSQDRMQQPPTLRGYIGQLLSLTFWSGLPLLERIRQPTLVVGGEDDPLAPSANAMLLACWLPLAKLLLAPGEGHLMPVDPHSIVLEPIRRFFEADPLAESAVWRDATIVNEKDLRAAIAHKRQAQPMGAIGAFMRRRQWQPAGQPSRA